jgi:hypothetical protein
MIISEEEKEEKHAANMALMLYGSTIAPTRLTSQ